MGITGLLPFLEKASKKSNLSEFRGHTMAIDTYCWLHKGAFACADKLARGENTDIHIQYCLKYINLLLSHNIKPILVFDGRHLSAKELTEKKRREVRKNAKKRAAELLRLGKIEEARSFLRRCVDITHEMALCLIKECRKRHVDCIVAPYEADAQLAFLNTRNIATIVITEDSDLTLFGCTKILFKLDLHGNGVLVDSSKLHLAMGLRPERFTFDKFRYMCILSGCDYLESLPGIGLAKACKFIKLTEDPDIYRALLRIPGYLNMKNLIVPEEYREGFMKADATFRHMLVYDPTKRRVVPLTDPMEAGTKKEYCCNAGEKLEADKALQLALGNLDPFTMKQLDNWHPDNFAIGSNSIWSKNFVSKPLPAPSDIRKVCFPTTFGKNCSIDTTKLIKATPKKKATYEESEENEAEISIADLTEIYGSRSKEKKNIMNIEIEESQSPKKEYSTKDATEHLPEGADTPTTPKKSHNPFAKNFCKNAIEASPEKLFEHNAEITSPIFKMNLSRNTSLIKTITSPKKGSKRKRLSKFDLTSVPTQNVASRFFKDAENQHVDEDEVFHDTPQEKSLNAEKIYKKAAKSASVNIPVFHSTFRTSQENNISSEHTKVDLKAYRSDSINSGFKNPLKKEECESTENVAEKDISDEEEVVIVQATTSLSQPLSSIDLDGTMPKLKKTHSEKSIASKIEPNKSKPTCRRPGLVKTKSVSNSSTQSRLSMFGFKKRDQISLS